MVHMDPSRQVQLNAVAHVDELFSISTKLFVFFNLVYFGELIASITVVILSWSSECDTPLRAWVLLFSGRHLIVVPLAWYRFCTLRHERRLDRRDQFVERLLVIYSVVSIVFGNIWFHSSDTCRETVPVLYTYSMVAMIWFSSPSLLLLRICIWLPFVLILGVLMVTAMIWFSSPLLLLLCICICLPFVLTLARVWGLHEEGAKLPTRKYGSQDTDNMQEPPNCAVCMNPFERDEALRILPCEHEYHQACVDQWLRIKKDCPLCRTVIDASRGAVGDESNEPNHVDIEMQPPT